MKRILLFSKNKDMLSAIEKRLNKKRTPDVLFLIKENEFSKAVETRNKEWLKLLLDIEHGMENDKIPTEKQQAIFLLRGDDEDKVSPLEKIAFEYYQELTGGDIRLFIIQMPNLLLQNILPILVKILDGIEEIFTINTLAKLDNHKIIEYWEEK